jgi:hypothetical protein
MPSDPATLGYLAGFLDGEGTIGISSAFAKGRSRNPSHFPHVMIANADRAVMEWIRDTVGGSLDVPRPSTHKPHWRPSYRWRLHGRNAETFIDALLPYLRVKRPQAEVVLRLRQIRGKDTVPHGTLTDDQVAA